MKDNIDKIHELESIILSKDKFLFSMGHELRNHLNVILGFTGTLLLKLPGPINAEQEKQLLTIKNSGNLLLREMNDFLEIIGIGAGRITAHIETFELQDILKEINKLYSPLAQSKNLEWHFIQPKTNLLVTTDKHLLLTILRKIAQNAVQFTEQGSITFKAEQQQGRTTIHIIDTGIGIKHDAEAKLKNALEEMKITGMCSDHAKFGLHLAQKLANLIHATIEFESEPGKSTRFSVSLNT
jgi:protein-histidine pros-kinase